MVNHELSWPRLSADAPVTRTASAALPRSVAQAEAVTPSVRDADRRWDPLMLCIAGYVLVAVGRVHQLFSVVALFRPAILMGALAILLFLADARSIRRVRWVIVPTTKFVMALLIWMALSTPGAIVRGTSFDLLFGNFIKTFVMFLVIAAGVRGIRDVERLAITYVASAAIYAAVIVWRFNLGEGDSWRLEIGRA